MTKCGGFLRSLKFRRNLNRRENVQRYIDFFVNPLYILPKHNPFQFLVITVTWLDLGEVSSCFSFLLDPQGCCKVPSALLQSQPHRSMFRGCFSSLASLSEGHLPQYLQNSSTSCTAEPSVHQDPCSDLGVCDPSPQGLWKELFLHGQLCRARFFRDKCEPRCPLSTSGSLHSFLGN